MHMTRTIALAAASALALSLLACSQPEEPKPTEEPAAEVEAEAPAEAEAAEGQPEWANGSIDVGESIGVAAEGDWQVEVFRVGEGVSDSDSMFVDPDTNENVLPAGSPLIYLNFVYTNVGDEPIELSYGITGRPSVEGDIFKFGRDYSSSSNTEEFEGLGLTLMPLQLGAEPPFVVQPGEAFAVATNIGKVSGTAYSTIRFVPVVPGTDDELDHDNTQEVTVEFELA